MTRGLDHYFATGGKDVKGTISFLNPYEKEGERTVDVKPIPGGALVIHEDGSKVPVNQNYMQYLGATQESQLSNWNDMLKFREIHKFDKPGLTPYDEESQKLAAKTQKDLVEQSIALDDKSGQIKGALDEFVAYNRKAALGTGVTANVLSKFRVDPELQQLSAKLGKLNLTTMVSTFQNMSRAIDSENDRAMFEKAQTGVITQPSVGVNLLVTANSASFAQQAENEARRQYIAEHHTEDKYKSPILGKQIVMYKDGEPQLVDKAQVKAAQGLGYMKNDDYAKYLLTSAPKISANGAGNGGGIKFLGFEQ
jgi:hypothetical protein